MTRSSSAYHSNASCGSPVHSRKRPQTSPWPTEPPASCCSLRLEGCLPSGPRPPCSPQPAAPRGGSRRIYGVGMLQSQAWRQQGGRTPSIGASALLWHPCPAAASVSPAGCEGRSLREGVRSEGLLGSFLLSSPSTQCPLTTGAWPFGGPRLRDRAQNRFSQPA